MQTDSAIPNNKSYIKIREHVKRTCLLKDVVISGNRNVLKKEAEKILKYADLII